MAQFFVVALFCAAAILLGLLQTDYFGRYTKHAALSALSLSCMAIISMFIFIEEEDWRTIFVASVEEKDKGKPSEGSIKLPQKDKGKGSPHGNNRSKGPGGAGGGMPGSSISAIVHNESEAWGGASERAEIMQKLAEAGYDVESMKAGRSGGTGDDDIPEAFMLPSDFSDASSNGMLDLKNTSMMAPDLDRLVDRYLGDLHIRDGVGGYRPPSTQYGMPGSLDEKPINSSPVYSSSVPINAKGMAEASGETTDREDDALQLLWDCKYCPRMVIVPVGVYVMGSPEDEPGHDFSESPNMHVSIAKPFAIGMFEVSKVEFDQFLSQTGHKRQGQCDNEGGALSLVGLFGKKELSPEEYAMPALCMSWWDANAYVEWLTEQTKIKYRLPSAAEWEYAARAQTQSAYHTGEDIEGSQARFYRSQRAEPAPTKVYSFKPNRFGLYNMHGNAAEWVADCWHTNLIDAPSHQDAWTWRGDCDYRVTKGGSWMDGSYDIRAAARGRQSSVVGNQRVGLRVVRDLY